MTDTLWKVTVSSLFPNDERVESVYEGQHADQAAACDAALTREAIENCGSTIARIVRVEEAG